MVQGHGVVFMSKRYFSHPTAIVEPRARIGEDTRIWTYAHIQAGTEIGARCKIGDYVFIEKGVRLGDEVTVKNGVQIWEGVTAENGVFIGPGCVFTNDLLPRSFLKRPKKSWLKKTRLKEGCSLGAGATLLCGIEIGRYAFVGAGALVTRSVPDYALVIGSPAVFHSWRCRCGAKLAFRKKTGHCAECHATFQLKNERVYEQN